MSLLSDELRDIVKPFRLARETDVARDIKANLFMSNVTVVVLRKR